MDISGTSMDVTRVTHPGLPRERFRNRPGSGVCRSAESEILITSLCLITMFKLLPYVQQVNSLNSGIQWAMFQCTKLLHYRTVLDILSCWHHPDGSFQLGIAFGSIDTGPFVAKKCWLKFDLLQESGPPLHLDLEVRLR